jgi:hypothetical protein
MPTMKTATRFALAALLVACPAVAAQYPGWGDTGWDYGSKRDCCHAAIAIAQEYSAKACLDSGGRPRPTTGQQRGSCKTEWMQDEGGSMLYRCYGEAAIWCR